MRGRESFDRAVAVTAMLRTFKSHVPFHVYAVPLYVGKHVYFSVWSLKSLFQYIILFPRYLGHLELCSLKHKLFPFNNHSISQKFVQEMLFCQSFV